MKEVCNSATKLRELHIKTDGFKGTSYSLRTNASVELRRVVAAWKSDSAVSEMPQDVEEGFTHASRSVVVLEKQLQRMDAQYTKMMNGLEKELKSIEGRDAKRYNVSVNFVRGINSRLGVFSSPGVCNDDHIAGLVRSLTGDKDTMLNNVLAFVSLAELAVKVKGQVTAAHDQIQNGVSRSAADAQAALEEAKRRARDADAGRHCTLLYWQMLEFVRRIW
ncbi:hypothetical protein ERJ75_001706900 [Trypanosoma vivax]|nr:hypothetical protein ERJ75_001706900 [Trypanosoma vivax]